MDIDLEKLMKYHESDLSDKVIKSIMYQIFTSLKYIHSAGIIHRDIKPNNILQNSNADVRICDFGLARKVDEDCAKNKLTYGFSLLQYKAPELAVHSPSNYTSVRYFLIKIENRYMERWVHLLQASD